jgi:elongator complex protein 1
MPRGNLECVTPRFLALPAIASALRDERFAAAAALAARHRVDLNLLVDYGTFYTLVPIRPRSRGERRSLRTFPGASLRAPIAFNPRPRRLSTPLLTPFNSTPGWPRMLRPATAQKFVTDVDDPDVIMELVEALDARDTTAPGGVYAHVPKGGGGGVDAATAAMASLAVRDGGDDGGGENKIDRVCAAIRAAVEARAAAAAATSTTAGDRAEDAAEARDAEAADDADAPERRSEPSPSPSAAPAPTLLHDRWELVMLSTHARSDPPNLGAALARVRARREAELAATHATTTTTTTTTTTPKSKSTSIDSAAALKHLIALTGGDALYAAALGTYDLSIAYLVGQHASMDPGEYVADLRALQDAPPDLRNAEIDRRLGRHESCVTHLLKGGDVEGACEVAAKRRLFPHALATAKTLALDAATSAAELKKTSATADADAAAPSSDDVATLVAKAYASQLSDERKHEDAAVALLSVGDREGALRAYRDALCWRPALALAGRMGLSKNARRDIAEELCEALSSFDPSAASRVASEHLGDVDRAVGLCCAAREWRESTRLAYANDRGDLVDTTVAYAAAEAASQALSDAREVPGRAEKYLARLRDLKRRRVAMAAATTAGDDEWDARRPGGGGGGDDDDDGASEAPSLASGMSAYTDRTAGAATETTGRSGSSLAPSTRGGRRGHRKGKTPKRKNSKGLRAGGPTEERDLATHLSNGGVATVFIAPRALEEIGELSELLILLGHAEDAGTLQRAVSAATAANDDAVREAKLRLSELDAEALARGELADVVGDEDAARKEAAKAKAAEGPAQWKWAVLRGGE